MLLVINQVNKNCCNSEDQGQRIERLPDTDTVGSINSQRRNNFWESIPISLNEDVQVPEILH